MIFLIEKRKNFFEKFGLAGRLAALACVLGLVFSIPGTILGAKDSMKESKMDFEEYKKNLEIRVQNSFELAVWNYDIDILEKFITTELENKNLSSFRISNMDNTLIWLSRKDNETVKTNKAPQGKYIERNVIPIYKYDDGGQVIANATLWYDRSESRNRFYDNLLGDIWQVISYILIITASISLILHYILVKPLETIRQSMVEAGKSSHNLAMEKIESLNFRRTFPEIQRMAADLGHMLQEIRNAHKETKDSEKQLKKLNDELEIKVAERTSELEKANLELEETIEDLENAQGKLVEKEKMAVLGQLVAGIAHELNTPLGIITSAGGTLERIIEKEIDQVVDFCANAPKDVVETYNKLVERGINGDNQDISDKRQNRKRYYKTAEENFIAVPDEVIEQLTEIGYKGSEEEFSALMSRQGSAEAIKMAYSFLTMHKSVQMIRISAEKASTVISALKTYSHRDFDHRIVSHDVIKDLEVVLTLYYNQTKYGIEIVKNYEKVLPVLCFPDRLYQVWVNIISNALQAMNYKGILVIGITQVQGEVKVSISDNGPGIPQTILHKIFEPFFTTKGLGEGTGLGLDIAKRIVEEVGGRIDVETEPGKTTFNVWLKTE